MQIIITNEDEMRAFGVTLAASLRAGHWVAIDGTLSAGKTVLCSGILAGLGFAGEVASPSYAIVHRYDPPDVCVPVIHADLYRIENDDEYEELGLNEDRNDCITLVEWAKNSGDIFGKPSHTIEIIPLADGTRQIEMKEYYG
jgi:tRNA threonylcarbamoyladenosine biosynthesis protein TsaE